MAVSLELAISAIRAGRKVEGRQLLNLLIQKNPNNAEAWLWMSSVVNSDKQRARCLYHVLSIEPDSKLARRGLKILGVEVSDTRPVKITSRPVSQPAQLPPPAADGNDKAALSAPQAEPESQTQVRDEPQTETEAADDAQQQSEAAEPEARRPFLIDPQRMTEELPFTPLRAPFSPPEPIQASPAILSIDVEKAETSNGHRPEIPENSAQSQTKTEPMFDKKPVVPEAALVETPGNEAEKALDEPAQQPAVDAGLKEEEVVAGAGPVSSVSSVSSKKEVAPSAEEEVIEPESAPATASNPLKTQKLPSIVDMLYGTVPQTSGSQPQQPVGELANEAAAPPESTPDPRTVETQKLQEEAPQRPPRAVTRPSQPVPAAASSHASTDPQARQVTPDVQSQMPAQPANPPDPAPAQPAPPPAAGSNQGQQPAPGTAYHQMPPPNSPGPDPNPGHMPAPPANGSNPGYAPQDMPDHQQQTAQQPYNDPNAASPPPETRPAQPILVNYPPPNPKGPPPPQQSFYYGGQQPQGQPPSNETMPMPYPNQQPPQHGQSTQPMPPPGHHGPANTGGQPQPNDYYRPPSEPVPVAHPPHSMGLVPYGYQFQQAPPGAGLHSNATVLMPNLSEAEIRARLATSQAIPTANAAAMPLQHPSGWPGAHPWYSQRSAPQEYDDDQEYESDGEVNVLAIIIFGTLSVTALGGLGMLILLILTTSPPPS